MDSGLNYVYVGNIPGHPGENTYCPKCGKAVIERDGFFHHKIPGLQREGPQVPELRGKNPYMG